MAEILNKCPECRGDGTGRWPDNMGGGKCYEFDCEACGGTGDADRFDSTSATREHIRHVKIRLDYCAGELRSRGEVHDASKLVGMEKEAFDRMTPLLKTLKYGSDEYKASLKELGTAATHTAQNVDAGTTTASRPSVYLNARINTVRPSTQRSRGLCSRRAL